mgnify:CR=1 FL=1
MALFISVQTGNWHDPLTWDAGSVPSLGSDDVIIADEHEVVFESGYYESLAPGRLLAIGTNSTLRIQGGIDAYDSDVIVVGEIIAEGSHLAIWGGGRLQIDPTGTVTIVSSFYLEWSATATVEGQLIIESGAWADTYDYATLTLAAGGTVQVYGYYYIEWDGRAVIRDNLSVETGGYLDVFDYASVTIEDSGAVFVYGTLSNGWYCLIDVFGYLGVHRDGFLRVYSYGQINVYNDIRVGGRMTGGGKIVMLRRDGRILDFNDNPIFVLDRAYGFGQTQIA